jgi:hypothetical protein
MAKAQASLPDTAALLVSGGDARILLDPVSRLSVYGCGPWPDPDLVALGSSTASSISAAGMAASDTLRQTLLEQLQQLQQSGADDHAAAAAITIYAAHAAQLRIQLLEQCRLLDAGIAVILAASGTDLHLLASQWLAPQCTVLVADLETGSGMPAALQGRHFNRRSTDGAAVVPGAPLDGDHGASVLVSLAVRNRDGGLIDARVVDAACVAGVDSAAQAGRRVLLVLTDVSKTGLIAPSIETALALKRRWPAQLDVLVDACQFRLAPSTLAAYLAHDCMVALTGSKFLAGPTFCGALLVPPGAAARCRDRPLAGAVGAYSNRADWPAGWLAARSLPLGANFGLLLRWQAALTELRALNAIPVPSIAAFLQRFADALRVRLATDPGLEALPVGPLDRSALGCPPAWDGQQTIFPFLVLRPVCAPEAAGAGAPLPRLQVERLYLQLRAPSQGRRRFQLGQPVPCITRAGARSSALRLCVSAPMIVDACQGRGVEAVIGDALAALDRIAELVAEWSDESANEWANERAGDPAEDPADDPVDGLSIRRPSP